MNNSDLISIIVPVYKVEPYLDRCIISIIEQSYSNIEIILVDDESPDMCPKMCDDWAQKDKRIKVIHKKNGGLSDARNIGLERATGSYICFVDSDDYVSTDFVEKLYNLICRNRTEISAVSWKKIFSTEFEEIRDEKKTKDKIEIVFEDKDAIEQLFSNDTFANYAWNKMYKRELFHDVKFPVGRKMEDLGTTYKLLLKANLIVYSSEELYFYYQREDSILHVPSIEFYRDKFELSRERYDRIHGLYPNMPENDFFYLKVLFEVYPILYEGHKDYNWNKEIRRAYDGCKKQLALKLKVKYLISTHCGIFYRYINQIKLKI